MKSPYKLIEQYGMLKKQQNSVYVKFKHISVSFDCEKVIPCQLLILKLMSLLEQVILSMLRVLDNSDTIIICINCI